MKERFLQYVVCPSCRGDLRLGLPRSAGIRGEIRSGTLDCPDCRTGYPIRNYIPRFVPSSGYAWSFAVEWRRHARTQLDSFSGTTITRRRFYHTTRWPELLGNQRVLEVGCGAGRFTEVALQTGCELVSFDLSEAVDVCLENHGLLDSWHPFQGDLHRLPLRDQSFDKVFCFGVLQHCPDVAAAFRALVPPLRSGGDLAIDVYERNFKIYLTPRFWLRLATSRMRPQTLYRIVERAVPTLLPLRTWLAERVPVAGRYLALMVPVAYYKGTFALSERQLLEWSILDTFDILSARYEHRMSIATVRDWFRVAGFADRRVEWGPNGIIGVGTKTDSPAALRPVADPPVSRPSHRPRLPVPAAREAAQYVRDCREI